MLYSIFQLHILINYFLIAVKQYFAIVIILADQNHAKQLLQCMRYIELMLNPTSNSRIIFSLGLGRRLQNNIRSFVSKNKRIFESSHVFLLIFYQCCSYPLIDYRMPPKLDYCFITSTSLVSVAVSTWI